MSDKGKAKKDPIQELKEAFAKMDPNEARRVTAALPQGVDITTVKPGDVIAIHYPTKAPKPQTSAPAE
jgi:hypothetical protein